MLYSSSVRSLESSQWICAPRGNESGDGNHAAHILRHHACLTEFAGSHLHSFPGCEDSLFCEVYATLMESMVPRTGLRGSGLHALVT